MKVTQGISDINRKKGALFLPPDYELLCWEESKDPVSIGWEFKHNYPLL